MPGWGRLSLPGAEILFSDRTGGVSAPPFDTANAGYGRGDDPAAVAENRRRIGAGLGGRAAEPEAWTCLHQVHGAEVFVAGSQDPPGVRGVPVDSTALPQADASVSTGSDAVLAILTADCAPVALVGPGVVGAVHAGWRGLAAGVLEAAVAQVAEMAGEPPAAVVGPCIHPCCYQFSPGDLDLVGGAPRGRGQEPDGLRGPGPRRARRGADRLVQGRGRRDHRGRRVHLVFPACTSPTVATVGRACRPCSSPPLHRGHPGPRAAGDGAGGLFAGPPGRRWPRCDAGWPGPPAGPGVPRTACGWWR